MMTYDKGCRSSVLQWYDLETDYPFIFVSWLWGVAGIKFPKVEDGVDTTELKNLLGWLTD